MPYFDTFDLETIDILLISQYVHLSLLPSSVCEDDTIETDMMGTYIGIDDEGDSGSSHRVRLSQEIYPAVLWVSPALGSVSLEQTSNKICSPSCRLRAFVLIACHAHAATVVLLLFRPAPYWIASTADDMLSVSISTTQPHYPSFSPRRPSRVVFL